MVEHRLGLSTPWNSLTMDARDNKPFNQATSTGKEEVKAQVEDKVVTVTWLNPTIQFKFNKELQFYKILQILERV